jgi:arsenate reductase (thioredoxin)
MTRLQHQKESEAESCRVLFVCQDNAFYSPMAALIAQEYGGYFIKASSAGLTPASFLDPLVLPLLAELSPVFAEKITADYQPKGLEEFQPQDFQAVVTLDSQEILLPAVWQRLGLVAHWSVVPPAEQPLTVLQQLRDRLEEQVRHLLRQLIFDLPL